MGLPLALDVYRIPQRDGLEICSQCSMGDKAIAGVYRSEG